MRQSFGLLLLANAVVGSQSVFSVHDDILAFPQYDIVFSDSFISNLEAESLLDLTASSASAKPTSPSLVKQSGASTQPASDVAQKVDSLGQHGGRDSREGGAEGLQTIYEYMRLADSEYLCSIPVIESVPKNEVAEAQARAEEAKELARAASRGWELLADMQGQCMYFLSGWWSYEFCYNRQVKQFHQQAPQRGLPPYPPVEDPATPSYILGRVRSGNTPDGSDDQESRDDVSDRHRGGLEGAELQVKGETRYLVQKLGAGTVCDLTGKERRVEVQFRCNPQAVDRIGWIKEVTTCAYLMVIDTPRLCDDAAFLPPRHNQAHPVTCQEILSPEQVPDWHARRAADAERRLLQDKEQYHGESTGTADWQSFTSKEKQPKEDVIVGGVRVGAQAHVGSEGRRIESGASVPAVVGMPDVIATGEGKGGAVQTVPDEKLKRLELNPETVQKLREELQEIAGEKGWKLELVEQEGGTKHIRGVVDAEEDEDEDPKKPDAGDRNAPSNAAPDADAEDREEQVGTEEGYYEEL
ncbi:MAG: hypothetical protein M4579_000727 [Chaenotheca gracillima]|nr:MAG: hypothetical protein M4579_000727 [Chaenotheca gracillima]